MSTDVGLMNSSRPRSHVSPTENETCKKGGRALLCSNGVVLKQGPPVHVYRARTGYDIVDAVSIPLASLKTSFFVCQTALVHGAEEEYTFLSGIMVVVGFNWI